VDTDIEPPRRSLKFATEMGHIQEEMEHFQEEMEHFHEEMRHFLLGIRVTGARLSEPQHVRHVGSATETQRRRATRTRWGGRCCAAVI
jgi:ketopantoate reductase